MQFAEIEISLNGADEKPRQLFEAAGLHATDIFIYNGDIHTSLYRVFRPHLGQSGRTKALLLLTTPGGDADAAYRIARHFQETYEHFAVAVWGHCKSAGTLLAIGASELIIEQCGELGPLDVQIFRPDEFIRRSSGLSVTQALEFITKKAFELWEESFLQVRQRSGGLITTKTASEIASQLAIGLFSPITEKIDPTWVGELQRSVDVAFHYGMRLGMNPESLQTLIQGFPSHSFVIDYRDAKKLFKSVRRPNDGERFLFQNILQSSAKEFPGDFLRDYIKEDLLMRISISGSSTQEIEVKGSNENQNHDNPANTRRRRSRSNASPESSTTQDKEDNTNRQSDQSP